MASITDRKPTEDQELLRRFVDAVYNVNVELYDMLQAWEALELGIGDSPSDVPGYPYGKSLDEFYTDHLNWKDNVYRWAEAIRTSDALKMKTIAKHMNQRWPELRADSHHSGGGIYGITIPFPSKTGGGPAWSLFWGTANDCWGADIVNAHGEIVGNVETPVRCDHADLVAVARAIALFSRDAFDSSSTKGTVSDVHTKGATVTYERAAQLAGATIVEATPALATVLPPPTPPDSIEQHPEGCPCSKCDIPF